MLDESTGGTTKGGSVVGFDKGEITSLGYAQEGRGDTTTLAIFQRIEDLCADQPAAIPSRFRSHKPVGKNGLWEKYRSFVRKLPPQEYIRMLVATYFREINYQYYPLDEATFLDDLQQWRNLGPSPTIEQLSSLPNNIRFLPALLFQMLALALLYQPPDYDRNLNTLKYSATMSLDDLSNHYSESGSGILSVLGKRHSSLVAVQAGFLRTTYLKTYGLIPESWHTLSQTIRDAQEFGLHKREPNRLAYGVQTPNQLWTEQLCRRMWSILALWDIHMAIILGRPTTIDKTDKGPILPIDCPIPRNRREVTPSLRTENDPPTPLTALLWSIELSAPLWDIYQLEKEGPSPLQIPAVRKLQERIIRIAERCPPCLRMRDPDTSFDSHPDCYWLHYLRPNIQNETAFSLLALHRPYIFMDTCSRTVALEAGLDILNAQRTFFDMLDIKDHKMSSLVIRTFDAIVVVAAIYILHPLENRDHLYSALQHFEWGMERFELLRKRNSMAKAGLGVLKAIYSRLNKALRPYNTSRSVRRLPQASQAVRPDPESNVSHISVLPHLVQQDPLRPKEGQGATLQSSWSNESTFQHTDSMPIYAQGTILNTVSYTPPTDLGWEPSAQGLQIAPNLDISTITTLQPMHDLVYNELSSVANVPTLDFPLVDGRIADTTTANTSASWQFEGDFGNDSFWGFMNVYNS